MVRAAIILFAFSFLLSSKPVSIVNLPQLNTVVQKSNDTLYVLNFWSTWCKPCIHELPYFENANSKFQNQKVKVVLVSLNFKKDSQEVKQFVTNRNIKADVMLLSAGNPNAWIDSVDKSWSGAIPATVMYRNGKKVFFYEGEFTQEKLDSIIQNKNK